MVFPFEIHDESDTESDNDDIDDIFYDEDNYIEIDKENNKYYIGVCNIVKIGGVNLHIVSSCVSIKSLFKYSPKILSQYFNYSSINNLDYSKVITPDILQIYIIDSIYTSVVKTFWLKMVQWKWKRVFKERMNIIRRRNNPTARHIMEMTGKYPTLLRYLPGLRGMMVD